MKDIIIPPRMRKGLRCYKCGTGLNVKHKNENGNNYCTSCYLGYSDNYEDRNIAAIARTLKCAESKARQVIIDARSRV